MDNGPAIIGVVKQVVSTTVATLVFRGQILKGRIIAVTPAVGDSVIAEYLPESDEYYIVAII